MRENFGRDFSAPIFLKIRDVLMMVFLFLPLYSRVEHVLQIPQRAVKNASYSCWKSLTLEPPRPSPSALFISVDDCSNVPADSHNESYEPQMNDGTFLGSLVIRRRVGAHLRSGGGEALATHRPHRESVRQVQPGPIGLPRESPPQRDAGGQSSSIHSV